MEIYYKIDPREDRLPKWAQDHMNALRSSIRQMQKALEQDVNDTNTFLQCSHPIEDEALPKNARIIFKTDEKTTWADQFQVHIENDTLKIYAATTVLIKPVSSNLIEIRMEDRRK
jgi:hypothetical protein